MTATSNLAPGEIRAALQKIPTTLAMDALKAHEPQRLVLHGVAPWLPLRSPVAGRARTLRFLPNRPDISASPHGPANFELIDSCEGGDVLVFDAMGHGYGSVLGDMLALRAKLRGAVAVITDGAIRDYTGMAEVGLPVFSRTHYPIPSATQIMAWERDCPIQCGGALVMPGDWILADTDAVIVIPPSLLPMVLERCATLALEEVFCRTLLELGMRLGEAFPMPAPLRPMFEQYLVDRRMPTPDEVRACLAAAVS
ncbi:RraA family protein [Burkholderia stagnalis]